MLLKPISFLKTKTASAAWTPASLPGLFAWYDPSDAATVTETTGDITQLNDKSGNSYNLTVSSTQPFGITTTGARIGDDTQNSLDMLSGFGTAAYFSNESNHVLNSGSGGAADIFIFGITKPASPRENGRGVFAAYGQATGGEHFGIDAWDNVPNPRWSSRHFNGYLSIDPTDPDISEWTAGNPYMVSAQMGSADGIDNVQFYVNGYADPGTGTGSGTTSNSYATTNNHIVLGNYAMGTGTALSSDSANFEGSIGEVVFVEGIPSTADRQKLEGYIAHKWGVTSLLDATHPYKSSAP